MMRRRRGSDRPEDRGSVTTELVLLTPLILIMMQFLTFTGRFSDARSDVVSAARDAARAASVQRTLADAETMAHQTAEATLAGEGIQCQGDPDVLVTTSGGFAPGNFVRVSVTCQVRLGDLAWIDIPGTRQSTHDAVEVIDQYRGQ